MEVNCSKFSPSIKLWLPGTRWTRLEREEKTFQMKIISITRCWINMGGQQENTTTSVGAASFFLTRKRNLS